MKIVIFFLLIFGVTSCIKPKTVLICGDHVCVNKLEAKQYFEQNLSLEVKIIDKKKNKSINLVELNLKTSSNGEKQVKVVSKESTKNAIKELTRKEIRNKKAELKRNKTELKKVKMIEKDTEKNINKQIVKKETKMTPIKTKKNVKKENFELLDICKTLNKCDINEISNYLIKLSKNKKFPDITTRE